MSETIALLLGAAFSVLGVLLLRASSRARRDRQPAKRRRLVTIAWALLVVAFAPWVIASGGDKGVSLAVIVFSLAGLALVIRTGFQHVGNGRRNVERDAPGSDVAARGPRVLLRRTWVFLLAGPVAAAAALFFSAAVFTNWNIVTGAAANRLAVAMLLMPFAWTLLAIYATYDVPLRYRSLLVSVVLFAGVIGTFLPEMI